MLKAILSIEGLLHMSVCLSLCLIGDEAVDLEVSGCDRMIGMLLFEFSYFKMSVCLSACLYVGLQKSQTSCQLLNTTEACILSPSVYLVGATWFYICSCIYT